MRRFTYLLIGAAAVMAVAVGAASGASAIKCGGLYQPHCAAPQIKPPTLSANCHKTGARIHVPPIRVTSVAGLKSIIVTVQGQHKPLASYKKLHSARSKTIRGLVINTAGLRTGVHTVTIKVTDVRNKTRTRSLRLAICKIKPPPFTG